MAQLSQDMQALIVQIDRQLETIQLKRKSIRDSMRGHTIPKYDLHREEEYARALRKSEYALNDILTLNIEEQTLQWVKKQIEALSQNGNGTPPENEKLFKSGMTDIEFLSAIALAINDLHDDGVIITQAAVIKRLGCAKQTFQKRFEGNNFSDYVKSVLDDKGYVSFSIKKKGE